MRAEGQIKQQLKQVTYRHLQKRLRENFRQRPDTCGHNVEVMLDGSTGASVGLCGVMSVEGVRRNVPCDARIAGCSEMARECPLFIPLQTRDEVKSEFYAIIQSGDRGVIASHFPDVAAMLWVLDVDPPTEAEIESHADQADIVEQDKLPPQSWWGGIRKKLGGGS